MACRSIVTAVNSLRARDEPHRRDLSAMPGLVPPRSSGPPANEEPPGTGPRGFFAIASSTTSSLALQVLADVLEDLANDRAQEEKRHDHDDRDQGQEQTVLNERLAILVLATEPIEKRADELNH